MCNGKKWLAGFMGLAMCLVMATAVKQNVRADVVSTMYVACTEDTVLYVYPDSTEEVAASLTKDSVMVKLEEDGSYTKVYYDGMVGYVESQLLIQSTEVAAASTAASTVTYGAGVVGQGAAMNLTATNEEVRMLAAIIQCEAGNQPIEGQIAVGAVIMNRVKSASYPNTIREVIFQPKQFGPSKSQLFADLLATDTIKDTCRQAATQAIMGVDNVGGAMHFKRAGSREGIVIGSHVFF